MRLAVTWKAMRISVLFLTALVLSSCSLAQMSAGPASQPEAGKIGPSAVWQPPQDFIAKAHAACDKAMNPVSSGECFINQMATQGAPGKAVSFSLMLYKESDGQVGIMTAFQNAGPVDMARVLYPLRANDNYGLLLVNGDPKV